MFVNRVLLGHPFVSQKPSQFRKPPCTEITCGKDDCKAGHVSSDSVIGTHKDGGVELIFREFIVYQLQQCYPEFLVEYERKQ